MIHKLKNLFVSCRLIIRVLLLMQKVKVYAQLVGVTFSCTKFIDALHLNILIWCQQREKPVCQHIAADLISSCGFK